MNVIFNGDGSPSSPGTGTGGTPYLLSQLWYGGGIDDSAIFNGACGPIWGWNRYLEDAEYTAEVLAYKALLQSGGDTLGPDSFLIGEGDSITTGQLATSYVNRVAVTQQVFVLNHAIPGSGQDNLAARQAVVGARIAEAYAMGLNPIISVMIGVNDAAADPVKVQALLDYYASRGARTILCTNTSCSSKSAATNNAYNAALRLLRYDVLCDVAAIAIPAQSNTLGGAGAYLIASIFPDQLHLSQAGYDLVVGPYGVAVTAARALGRR